MCPNMWFHLLDNPNKPPTQGLTTNLHLIANPTISVGLVQDSYSIHGGNLQPLRQRRIKKQLTLCVLDV